MNSHRASRFVPTLRWSYLACVVLGGIGAHLVSEFAAMGADAAPVSVSPRHIYLGIACIAALAFLVRDVLLLRARATSGRDAKRIAEIGLASLPFAGKRQFWIATAGLQFAIGAFTEVGEGCPLCGHDVAAGIGGALFGAIVLALLVRALSTRLPSIAAALVAFAPIDEANPTRCHRAPLATEPVVAQYHWYARLFSRPPPTLQSAFIR